MKEMGDVVSPFIVSSSPKPSPSSNIYTIPFLYYGLVVVGTATIVLAIYNLIIIKCCSNRVQTQPSQPSGHSRSLVELVVNESRSFNNNNSQKGNFFSISSFKYKKEVVLRNEGGKEKQQQQGGVDDYECPVCLSFYEEGDDVKNLPLCKHSFHAICIDMWLYSHFDCPICRTPVAPFFHHPFPAQNSHHGFDSTYV
ncbi:unnamed protein product [Lupinus luteus]|uniref:RING-type E3 ubiquitin transferase n=1 Tax=Lupinus luteus TaxID=3873 RepID=A0AAV1XEY1_LUPLU